MGTSDVKVLSLRRDGACGCGRLLPKGTRAGWDRARKVVICELCLTAELSPTPTTEPTPTREASVAVEPGSPGESLQREYERRMAVREARVTARFPRIGRFLLTISGPAQTTKAFAIGAEGEREVASRLERDLGSTVMFLYNRRRGTGREAGDIDILAIAPSGVWIIDPKKYAGRKVRSGRSGSVFVVDGRRRPHLVESMRRQLTVVTAAMVVAPDPQVPVHAAYCFVGADLPWGRLVVDGVPALSMKGTVKQLRRPGPLGPNEQRALHGFLAERFPPA